MQTKTSYMLMLFGTCYLSLWLYIIYRSLFRVLFSHYFYLIQYVSCINIFEASSLTFVILLSVYICFYILYRKIEKILYVIFLQGEFPWLIDYYLSFLEWFLYKWQSIFKIFGAVCKKGTSARIQRTHFVRTFCLAEKWKPDKRNANMEIKVKV